MRPPSATPSAVAPGGVGSAPAACVPASGWMPSGGTAASGDELSDRVEGTAAATNAAEGGARGGTRRRDDGRGGRTAVLHPPNPPALVVRYIKCAVRSDGEAGRAVHGQTGLFHGAGGSVGEHHERPRRLTLCQGLEHNIIAAVGERRAIPR